MKPLLVAIAFAFVAAPALAEPASAPANPQSALYSFADVYRLTVGGPIAGVPGFDPAPEMPVRVAAAQAQPAEPRFVVRTLPQPDKWLLVFAGLALAGWVAHRRLVHAL
ncbi:MAG TPA: hypothetical protein VFB53_10615 [Burkholderiales bacterium]|nr:hypothetical protein [Burkholderiales bacterium]